MKSVKCIGVHGLKFQGGGIKFRLLHTESTLLNTDLEILGGVRWVGTLDVMGRYHPELMTLPVGLVN